MFVPRLYTQKDKGAQKAPAARIYHDADFNEYSVPAQWGQSAAEVLVQDVFCRAAIPALLKPAPEDGVPEFLWRRQPDDEALDGISAEGRYRHERGFDEVFARIAGGLTYHGWKAGLFDGAEDARAFHDEFIHMLLHQIAAPEIALLAAAGLDWAYGMAADAAPAACIKGFSDALFAEHIAGAGVTVPPDAPEKNILKRLKLLAERQALDDDGQRISVTLPVENSASPSFVTLKREADAAAAAQGLGGRVLEQALHHVMDACDRDSLFGFDPARNLKLRQAAQDARRAGVTEASIRAAIQYAQQGMESIDLFSEAEDVPQPMLNATLSVPDDFIESALTGHGFLMSEAGEPKRHYPAEKLWNSVASAIWSAGEPAIFFRDSAASASALSAAGEISASGRGGLLFLQDTAAPAAALNLQKFMHPQQVVDAEKIVHAVKILAIALDASFAFVSSGLRTRDYRPVCIGVTGMAHLLMSNALSYDSEAGRATAALVAALVTGAAHDASSQMAASAGAFPAYARLEKECLQNLKDMMSALSGAAHLQKGLSRRPAELKTALCPAQQLPETVKALYARAYIAGKEKGFRHAHVTAMDTGEGVQALLGAQARDIGPVQNLVRFEGHFGGGDEAGIYGKKLSPAVPQALGKMGFTAKQLDDVTFYAAGHGTLLDAPAINHQALKAKGFHRAALDALESALATAQHIRYVFNKWTLGDDFCRHMLGFSEEELSSGTFDMLSALGFSEDDIDAANLYCCGAMTLEGAPHVHPKHLSVFDCAVPSGAGVRRVAPEAQIRMQAAIEPFLSGCVFHTVELGHYAAIDEVRKLLLLGWELGVKRLKIYRDGCSLLHPVMMPAETDEAEEEEQALPQLRIRARAN